MRQYISTHFLPCFLSEHAPCGKTREMHMYEPIDMNASMHAERGYIMLLYLILFFLSTVSNSVPLICVYNTRGNTVRISNYLLRRLPHTETSGISGREGERSKGIALGVSQVLRRNKSSSPNDDIQIKSTTVNEVYLQWEIFDKQFF